jgi:hypothetical protein
LGDSDESDEAVSPKKIFANVQRRLSSFTVLYQHPGNARINYIRFDLVEGGRKRSGRRDVRYAVRVDFSFLIDILGKANEKGFRIKQALIQRNLL